MVKKRGKAIGMRVVKTGMGGYPHLHRIIACEERLEEAAHFLSAALQKPRRGKKPVLLHSIRVGFGLLANGAPTDVVIAGLLHDVMERTRVTTAQISRKFGADVGALVKAVTNDMSIADPYERYADSLARCAAVGPGALFVRASDLIDNTDRSLALGMRGRLERISQKLSMLIETCRAQPAGALDPLLLRELRKRLRRVEKVRTIVLVPKKPHAAAKGTRQPLRHARRG